VRTRAQAEGSQGSIHVDTQSSHPGHRRVPITDKHYFNFKENGDFKFLIFKIKEINMVFYIKKAT